MATLQATIEQPRRVNSVVFNHIAVAQAQANLAAAQAYLEQHFKAEKSWFVFRGGSHISLHRRTSSGAVMGPRIAIIVERQAS